MSPRILYAGPLDPLGECLTRLNLLREIEPNVTAFDTQSYLKGTSFWERLDRRSTFSGSDFAQSNAAFLALCDERKPDIAWIDKGLWLWPSTLETVRKRGVFLVQHNTDKLSPQNWSAQLSYRLLRRGLRYYHLYFTSNLLDFAMLKHDPSPVVHLTYLGYDPKRFNADPLPDDLARKWASDLVFPGHYEPRTERFVLALMDAGLKPAIYGSNWEKAKHPDRIKPGEFFTPISQAEYVYAIKSAKIGLSFISEWNGNQTAGRTFQIAAAGRFLLAMRSQQHIDSFVEGEEAEFFSTEQELVNKAKYYLEHDSKRLEIARRGYERCLRSGYTIERYMRDDWAKVRAQFSDFKGPPS